MKLTVLVISFLSFWTSCSNGAKIWSGESSITAVRGKSATMTWSVNLTDGDANLVWTYVKIVNLDSDTTTDVVIFRKTGQKTVGPSYQSRASDLTSNITQTGSVVTIMFTMANLRTTDEMKYKAMLVFASDLTINPGVTLLVVQVPPTITAYVCEGCQNGSAVENQNITLWCTATGKPVPNITWMKNGAPYGGTGNKLVFQQVSIDHKGNYTCMANNSVGNPDRKSLTIIVKFPSSCKIYSSATILNETESVELNFTSTGNPPVNDYFWIHPNGSRLTWDTERPTFTASRQDNGIYKVSVYNGVGGRSNCTRNITVQYKPYDTKISHSPNKTILCNGSVISITCTSNANPAVEKYSLNINNNSFQESENGLFTAVLLNKIGTNKFTCVPKNMLGPGENQDLIPISVQEPPKITNCQVLENEKEKSYVVEGRKVELKCNISGSEPLNKTWTNGKEVWNNSTLVFQPINRSDDGTYKLTVSNGEECNKTESSLKLDVYYVPESTTMEIRPDKTNFCRGDQIQVNCSASAKPQAKYSLYKNGEPIGSNGSGYFTVHLDKSGNINITCVPSNEAGDGKKISKTGLVVKDPPKITNCQVLENGKEKSYVVEGSNVELKCDISGSEPLNKTWTIGQQVWHNSTLVFQPINRSHNGTFKLTVSNGEECNKTESSLELNVYYVPESTTMEIRPDKTNFCRGDQIQVNCSASAKPQANYSLYQNDKLISSNGSGYFTVHLDKSGNINITCVPSNEAGDGKIISKTGLVVKEPPKITNCQVLENEKEKSYVVEGRKVELKCNISGSEPLNKTWTIGQQVWHNSTLVFQPINRSDYGTYKLTVSNGEECNKTESSLELDVYYVPESTTIEIRPDKTNFCRGDQIQVNCSASAKPQANYSLYQNDKLISSSGSGYFTVHLDKSGNINITCVPSNEAGDGKVMSKTGLVVKEPPKITNCQILQSGKEKSYVVEGSNVELKCNISGSEPLNKTWTNGKEVWHNSTLVFQPINRSDYGTYKLTVSNGEECNKTESSLELDVYYVPESTTMEIRPDKTNFCRGDQIQVNCSASAKPQANYSLYQNDKLISSSGSGYFTVHLDKSGNINITCVPSNEAGDGKNINKTGLVVKDPPKITNCQILENGKEQSYVVEGSNVELKCNISGSEQLNKTWTNGQQDWHNSTLVFQPINRIDDGIYNLTVSNGEECSKTETSLKLDVCYLDKLDICNNSKLGLVNKTNYLFTVIGNPKPQINCTTGENSSTQRYYDNENGIHNVSVPNETEVICKIKNKAGYCDFTLSLKTPQMSRNYSFKITNLKFDTETNEELSNNVTQTLRAIYEGKPYYKSVTVIELIKGSVIVNFQLIVVGVAADYLQPLKDAVIENSPKLRGLSIDSIQKDYATPTPPTTTTKIPTTVLPTEASTTPKALGTSNEPLSREMIIVIAVVVSLLVLICIIVVIVVIVCLVKKKRSKKRKNGLVAKDGVVEVPVNDDGGANDNLGYSQSQYAEHGPSHEPKVEPTYAAVIKDKKTKRRNPEELQYAELAPFQKNHDQAASGHGDIALKPLPQGQHAKEDIYATIVGTKEAASEDQNAIASSTDGALGDLDGQGAKPEAQKVDPQPSEQTADPTLQNEEKPGTSQEGNPPGDQQVQPQTKEDSGKEESVSAESSVTKFKSSHPESSC